MPENLASQDGFSRPVPRQPAHLHTQAESGAYLRDPSRVPRGRPIMKPPYAIESVPSLSGHANTYRWRSLPRVRRHRAASKPQDNSERVLSWQITMDQLICASFSRTRYWYEVGILKVPASIVGAVIRPPHLTHFVSSPILPDSPPRLRRSERPYFRVPPLGRPPNRCLRTTKGVVPTLLASTCSCLHHGSGQAIHDNTVSYARL